MKKLCPLVCQHFSNPVRQKIPVNFQRLVLITQKKVAVQRVQSDGLKRWKSMCLFFLLTRHVHRDLQQAHPFHTTRCHQARTRRHQKSKDVAKHRRKKTAFWRFFGAIFDRLERVNKAKGEAVHFVVT